MKKTWIIALLLAAVGTLIWGLWKRPEGFSLLGALGLLIVVISLTATYFLISMRNLSPDSALEEQPETRKKGLLTILSSLGSLSFLVWFLWAGGKSAWAYFLGALLIFGILLFWHAFVSPKKGSKYEPRADPGAGRRPESSSGGSAK
jgi:hypothetical protein